MRGAVVLTERPRFIARDGRGRLHCEDRAAIEYPDGWGVYAWHGLRVPERLIKEPESITCKEIDGERNAEIRRVMIERYGAAKYLMDSGAEKLHEDECGTLYRRPRAGDDDMVMVRVVNATPEALGLVDENSDRYEWRDGSAYKVYWLRVHPELRPLLPGGGLGEPQKMTARAAVAASFGLRSEEYTPEAQS